MRKSKVIYIIGVFLLRKDSEGNTNMEEFHNISWYPSLKDAEGYLESAGRHFPGWPEDTFHDDPFEYRWTHCVIEEVKEGRWATPNRICSWWRSVQHKGQLGITARKLKHPPKGLKIGNCLALTFP